VNRLPTLAVIAALAVGCVSPLPPAPAKSGVVDFTYLIGPGDELRIDVYRQPELSGVFPVRPDGMLATPLLEPIVASGRTPEELARVIEAKAAKLVQHPNATVVVMRPVGSPATQVRILGQVAKPTTVPYRKNLTLLDAVLAAGGLTDYAAGNRAVLIRQGEGGKQYNLRVRDLLKGGDVSANVELRPGDVILIPESML
jgi:polysaccharide export outer membrane protein